MGNPKTTAGFPAEFAQMWGLAMSGNLDIRFDRKGTAINMKQRLYAYRRVLSNERGGLAAQPLYNTDLEIVEVVEGTMPGLECINKCVYYLRASLPDWKKQVREASAIGANHTNPVVSVPIPEIIVDTSGNLDTPSALDKTLEDIGFKS